MKPQLEAYLATELANARQAEADSDMDLAWRSLERAHILSQGHPWAHTRVHARMFDFARRRRDWRELLGQLPRVMFAAPADWLGRAPLGNTGGANVGMLTPMPIPDDLAAMLADDEQ